MHDSRPAGFGLGRAALQFLGSAKYGVVDDVACPVIGYCSYFRSVIILYLLQVIWYRNSTVKMDCCTWQLGVKQAVTSATSAAAQAATQTASHGLHRKRYESWMQVLWLRPAGL